MHFCGFCRDFMSDTGLQCARCHTWVCQVMNHGESGCAMLFKVPVGRPVPEFLCVQCLRIEKKSIKVSTTCLPPTSLPLTIQLQYFHEGYARMRLHSKTLGPTVVIGLILHSLKNTALGWKLTSTTMETEFAWANHQVCSIPFPLPMSLTDRLCSCACARFICKAGAEQSPKIRRPTSHSSRFLISSRRRACHAASLCTLIRTQIL